MSLPDWYSGAIEVLFQIVDGVSAVVKNRSGKRGIGFAFGKDLREMVRFARASGCNHRNVCGSGHCSC